MDFGSSPGYAEGINGNDGNPGGAGNVCGTVIVRGTVDVTAKGGEDLVNSSGGGDYSDACFDEENHEGYLFVGYPGGGGGGGGSGCSASDVGGGGGGGGSGGAGGSGAVGINSLSLVIRGLISIISLYQLEGVFSIQTLQNIIKNIIPDIDKKSLELFEKQLKLMKQL